MHPRAEFLIRELQLEPHPEGGFYRRVFESACSLPGGRAASSSIFFLLPQGGVSRWHRVDADETWHFYEGEPLELLVAESAFAGFASLVGQSCCRVASPCFNGQY